MEFVLLLAALLLLLLFWKERERQHRTEHEMQTMRYEFITRIAQLELEHYMLLPGSEVIRFAMSPENIPEAFAGKGAIAWDYINHRFADGTGAGSHEITGNVIQVNRTNKKGRYEIYLKHYSFGSLGKMIPADLSVSKRRFRITAEVKKGGASHILRFVFKGESQNVLDEKDYVVFNPDWEPIDLVFTIDAKEASYLRIDDLSVLRAPSNVQIRNLKLLEKR